MNIVKKYLLKDEPTFENLHTVFLKASEDFLAEQLSVDDYSTLMEEIDIELRKMKSYSESEFASICQLGAELNWYVRHAPEKGATFLEKILAYYRDHKI